MWDHWRDLVPTPISSHDYMRKGIQFILQERLSIIEAYQEDMEIGRSLRGLCFIIGRMSVLTVGRSSHIDVYVNMKRPSTSLGYGQCGPYPSCKSRNNRPDASGSNKTINSEPTSTSGLFNYLITIVCPQGLPQSRRRLESYPSPANGEDQVENPTTTMTNMKDVHGRLSFQTFSPKEKVGGLPFIDDEKDDLPWGSSFLNSSSKRKAGVSLEKENQVLTSRILRAVWRIGELPRAAFV